jgi:hypothetical protein
VYHFINISLFYKEVQYSLNPDFESTNTAERLSQEKRKTVLQKLGGGWGWRAEENEINIILILQCYQHNIGIKIYMYNTFKDMLNHNTADL